jgi:hypothetical protein
MKKEWKKMQFIFLLFFLPNKLIFTDDIMVYSFPKPDDMASVIQEMRTIARSFRGTFSGNEYSGSFDGFGSNTKITYSVNGNLIVYTVILTGNVNNTIQQKLMHSFSIDLPKNVSQALEAVKTGIEAKGGSFYGNEFGGYFRNSGIMGNYVVEGTIAFYIFEKPFIIPNSVIEREIRSYFSGK